MDEMTDFRLPSHKAGPVESLRKQLRASGKILTACQLIVGAGLPVVEGVLVNLATSAEGQAQRVLIGALAVVGLFHVLLLSVVVAAETPLPQFLVEFDEQDRTLRQTAAIAAEHQAFAETFGAATLATRASLLAIEKLEGERKRNIEEILGEVLGPWIEQRTEIFWFRDGDALYNFAVYLQRETGSLRKAFRKYDDRINATNREWPVGCGHVGMCFAQGKTIFSADSAATDADDLLETDRPEDKSYYRALASTPIVVDGEKRGVFIVTSSKANQFEKALHLPIIEVVAILLGQSLKHCGEEAQWHVSTQPNPPGV